MRFVKETHSLDLSDTFESEGNLGTKTQGKDSTSQPELNRTKNSSKCRCNYCCCSDYLLKFSHLVTKNYICCQHHGIGINVARNQRTCFACQSPEKESSSGGKSPFFEVCPCQCCCCERNQCCFNCTSFGTAFTTASDPVPMVGRARFERHCHHDSKTRTKSQMKDRIRHKPRGDFCQSLRLNGYRYHRKSVKSIRSIDTK